MENKYYISKIEINIDDLTCIVKRRAGDYPESTDIESLPEDISFKGNDIIIKGKEFSSISEPYKIMCDILSAYIERRN